MPKTKHTQDIIAEVKGSLGCITLNRPKALNALTRSMIDTISSLLHDWEENESVKAICFQGAGDRAFCAGGDIKYIYHQGLEYKNSPDTAENPDDYFYAEYNLNRQLYHYPKPLIAIMDGITMGGGFGLAGPCDYRIATNNMFFAMPEVGIGFFPDIGGVHYLSQCQDFIGRYLCLTGNTIEVDEALYSGVATHVIKAADIDDIVRQLSEKTVKKSHIDHVLKENAAKESRKNALKDHIEVIKSCFAPDCVPEILQALDCHDDKWAQGVADIIRKRSPLSVCITMKHLVMAEEEKDFDRVIMRDFLICQHFMGSLDFYEGVRAAVIDKDRAPQWQHKTIQNVMAQDVDSYFEPAKRVLF